MGKKIIINPGDRFGRLTVIEELPRRYCTRTNGKQTSFREVRASCDCGNKTTTAWGHLRSGHTTSCGCAMHPKKHGYSYKSEYHIWQGMNDRCKNTNSPEYHRYGGRGIEVCDRWKDSFENFIADMGDRPSKSHSIDRIDNNGNYEPGNCRWATRQQQQQNTRTNRYCEFRGQRKCLVEWARMAGRTQQCFTRFKTEDEVRAHLEKWVERGILVIDC